MNVKSNLVIIHNDNRNESTIKYRNVIKRASKIPIIEVNESAQTTLRAQIKTIKSDPINHVAFLICSIITYSPENYKKNGKPKSK